MKVLKRYIRNCEYDNFDFNSYGKIYYTFPPAKYHDLFSDKKCYVLDKINSTV